MKANGKRCGVGDAELRQAAHDFRVTLRCRGFTRDWIEEHADELLAQAWTEYTAKFTDESPARRPVGWLIQCAWWRAQDLRRRETREPRHSSLDEEFHLADKDTPTPEQQALEADELARLRRVLGRLPEKDCNLLSLVYFEGYSIREAARKIGLGKSTADRRHSAALEKLRAFAGEDRRLLSPATLGLAAWTVGGGEGRRPSTVGDAVLDTAHRLAAIGADLTEAAARRLGELWRRLGPLADPAGAAASGGGGRTLGACGVAAASVLCVAAGAVVPAVRQAPPQPAPSAAERVKTREIPSGAIQTLEATTTPSASPERDLGGDTGDSGSITAERSKPRERRRHSEAGAPVASTTQTVNEFGVEASPATSSSPARPATGYARQGASPTAPSRQAAPPSADAAPPHTSEFGL